MIPDESIEKLIQQNAELLAQNRQLIAMLQQGQSAAQPLPAMPSGKKLSPRERRVEIITAWAYDNLKKDHPNTLFPVFLRNLQKIK